MLGGFPMKNAFYISDLDGTLLSSKSVLSEYAREALERFDAHKVPFSLATGRSYASMRHVMEHTLHVDLPVITFDGALISSFNSPRPIYLNEIDSHISGELVRLTQKEGFNIFLDILEADRTEFLFEDTMNDEARFFVEAWKQPQAFSFVRHVPLINHYLKKTIVSLSVIDSPDRITWLKEKAQQEFAGAPIRFDQESFAHFKKEPVDILWILPDSAHKATAVREFCQIKGIDLKDVTFFGDNTNDLSVFRMKEVRKIAVANAIEPVRALADQIIGTNNEDSVIRFIEEDHKRGLVDL
jgi:Cof subfamily protein (haloacid dehalogenase superfamily)